VDASQRIVSRNRLSAEDIRGLLQMALEALHRRRAHVDALNVFPVPDGDTGTNMTLTMQSAWKEVQRMEEEHAGRILRAFAMGAIRGARGNSGVILSQILRGMADAVGELPALEANDVARAFRQGQKTAYKGVMQPVEGTILTIISAIAGASEHAVALRNDIAFLFETSLEKAKETLEQTPNMLPVLKHAGVVDAGGQGLVYLLEGMTAYVLGADVEAPGDASMIQGVASRLQDLGDEWGYDIQFLIYHATSTEEEVRKGLIELGGESIVVGRIDNIIKVHVHGDDPGPFLSFGVSLGRLDDIVVENMTLQTLRRRGEWTEDGPMAALEQRMPSSHEMTDEHCVNVIAVTPGDGFARVFRSLGACEVVSGGQTMNPSTQDLLLALEKTPEAEVILLPNNKNIVLAAHQAAELSQKQVYVVETITLPQGIAAMFAFNPTLTAAENARQMQAMSAQVHTIEVTTAVRDATIHGVAVSEHSAIAVLNGELCCAGEDPQEVTLRAISLLEDQEESEIITIYYGQPSTEQQARQLVQRLKTRYPHTEIDLLWGGQPHYHYIISVE